MKKLALDIKVAGRNFSFYGLGLENSSLTIFVFIIINEKINKDLYPIGLLNFF